VRDYTSRSYMSPLSILSLFGRGLSARRNLLIGLVRDTRGSVLPSAMSGGAFFYFQSNASTNSALNSEWSTNTDLLLILVLVTYLFCDTACSTALGIFAEVLIAPFWHRARDRRPASTMSSPGVVRSLRQWLCSSSRIEKNSRPSRFIQISHNPPPHIPSLSTHCCI
jgi:hypothetical protein